MVEVLHAGSLTRLVREGLAPALRQTTGVEVTSTPRGSILLANGIRDGSLRGDVFLSADVTANDLLLGPANHHRIRWFVTFAGNEVVFAFNRQGRFAPAFEGMAGELGWHEVVTRPGFRLRRGDPDTDPLAYYIVMVCQLAEAHYARPGLKAAVLGSDRNPAQLAAGVPIPLSDEVDGAFLYLNGALDYDVPFVRLPPAINLADPAHAEDYARASYTTSDTGRVFRGRPIAFSAAILEDATDLDGATELVRFLCSRDGQHLVEGYHFRPGPIALGGDVAAVPAPIAALATTTR